VAASAVRAAASPFAERELPASDRRHAALAGFCTLAGLASSRLA
jgi:hypothetical protein